MTPAETAKALQVAAAFLTTSAATILASIGGTTTPVPSSPDAHDWTGLSLNAEGWHDWSRIWQMPERYNDSRVVYVDSLMGDDATGKVYAAGDPGFGKEDDPFNPGEVLAFRTVPAAAKHLRHGFADIMLIRRGTTFEHPLSFDVGRWKKSGASRDERMIVGCYPLDSTAPRPRYTGREQLFRTSGGGGTPERIENLAVVGLEHDNAAWNPDDPAYDPSLGSGNSIGLDRDGDDILFEDVRCSFGQVNVQSGNRRCVFYRCAIDRNYETNGSNTQGAFISHTACRVLFDECVLWRGGWHPTVRGGAPHGHKRTLYASKAEACELRNCAFVDSASEGFQLRSDVAHGTAVNNLILRCPLGGFQSGRGQGSLAWNVCLHGCDFQDGSGSRAWGLWIQSENCPDFGRNIVAHKMPGAGSGFGISTTTDDHVSKATNRRQTADVHDNIVHAWPGIGLNLRSANEWIEPGGMTVRGNRVSGGTSPLIRLHAAADPSKWAMSGNAIDGEGLNIDGRDVTAEEWNAATGDTLTMGPHGYPDPNRTMQTYMAAQGESLPTWDAAIDAWALRAVENRRGAWQKRWTAPAVNEYIREGFGVAEPGGTSKQGASPEVSDGDY